LANEDASRTKIYQELFRVELDDEAMKNIKDAWLTGTPLGNHYFKEMVETKLMRKVGYGRRDRPLKQTDKGL
jgi:putative transposase